MNDIDQLIELCAAETQLANGAPVAWVLANHQDAVPIAQQLAASSRTARAPRWTRHEDQFLTANLGWMSEEEIAARLGRSVNGVHLRWKRELLLPAPSKHPDWISGNAAAGLLGVDGHSIMRLVDRGLLPARLLPGGRKIRMIRRDTLRRWVVNPMNWIYFKGSVDDPRRIADPHLRRLIERQKQRWNDAWWSPGQVAAYHGVDHSDVNRYLHAGKLKGVKWGNWWVLRSEALKPSLVFFKGKGAAQGFREWGDEGDAFLVLARAVGLPWSRIGRLMGGRKPSQVAYRFQVLHGQEEISWLIQKFGLQVSYSRSGGCVFADWRRYRRRFPGLAAAVTRFHHDQIHAGQLHLVRMLLGHWARWYAVGRAQQRLAYNLQHATLASEDYVRQAYQTLRAWGVDPLDLEGAEND